MKHISSVNTFSTLLIIFSLLFTPLQTVADNNTQPVSTEDHILVISERISELEEEIKTLNKEINHEAVVVNRQALIKQRDKKLVTLENLQSNFEDLSTGKADISVFEKNEDSVFNISDELKKIFGPALKKIKRLTEKSRTIDLLESENAFLERQVSVADHGLEEITALLEGSDDSSLKNSLSQLHNEWSARKKDAVNQIHFNNIKIAELQQDSSSDVAPGLSEFVERIFLEHFQNIVITILLSVFIFVTIKFVGNKLARIIWLKHNAQSRSHSRLIAIFFDISAVVLTSLAAVIFLFLVSDWIILALLTFILIGLAFSLKDSIPSYLDEARYLLNYGAAREGERVIYNGIPWKLSRINYYSTLINPALSGGRIRLPLSKMTSLLSRRWSESEPWFPTKKNDYVLLDDGVYGQVILQTPEQVQIQQWGKQFTYYRTVDYLAQSPINLSHGFTLFVTFGLDYGLQKDILEAIPKTLEEKFYARLPNKDFADAFENASVKFKAASSSSLDVVFIVTFTGDAAPHYYAIQRFCQNIAVDACNENDWTIPFTQLTVSVKE